MIKYRNKLSSVLYPMAEAVPFPIGTISYLSVYTPQNYSVYVTSISSGPDNFILSLADQSGKYSCIFKYSNNLIIKSQESTGMFGILELVTKPVETFSYTGKWKLCKRAVQANKQNSSYSNIIVNGKQYTLSGSLNIQFNGYIKKQNSYIIRDTEDKTIFSDTPSKTAYTTVNKINNVGVQHLNIVSKSQTIQIAPIIKPCDNYAVLYINTTQNFPVCADQR